MERRTIANSVSLQGVGRRNGVLTNMVLKPAKCGAGIVFTRKDLNGFEIEAKIENQRNSDLNTRITKDGVSVYLIEHLMATIWGFRITDLIIEIDSEEVPIFDGSAEAYLFMIRSAGIKKFGDTKIPQMRVTKEVFVEGKNDSWIKVIPSDHFEARYDIDFAVKTIGRGSFVFDERRHRFSEELAICRTFCTGEMFEETKGKFKNWTKNNSIVFYDDRIENGEHNLLRYREEPARHKLLDLIGDLMLSGYFIVAKFECNKSGHALNALALREILKEGNFEVF